ncbi:hypothetical protein GGH13_009858, partial [Coemansia sp. S155-1]
PFESPPPSLFVACSVQLSSALTSILSQANTILFRSPCRLLLPPPPLSMPTASALAHCARARAASRRA